MRTPLWRSSLQVVPFSRKGLVDIDVRALLCNWSSLLLLLLLLLLSFIYLFFNHTHLYTYICLSLCLSLSSLIDISWVGLHPRLDEIPIQNDSWKQCLLNPLLVFLQGRAQPAWGIRPSPPKGEHQCSDLFLKVNGWAHPNAAELVSENTTATHRALTGQSTKTVSGRRTRRRFYSVLMITCSRIRERIFEVGWLLLLMRGWMFRQRVWRLSPKWLQCCTLLRCCKSFHVSPPSKYIGMCVSGRDYEMSLAERNAKARILPSVLTVSMMLKTLQRCEGGCQSRTIFLEPLKRSIRRIMSTS